MSNDGQFEHIENKIKQSLEGQHPAFDEKAWTKMEALLDKEDKKKRPFFWLRFVLPVLFIGAGALYYFTSNNSDKTSTNKQENKLESVIANNSLQKEQDNDIKPSLQSDTQKTVPQQSLSKPGTLSTSADDNKSIAEKSKADVKVNVSNNNVPYTKKKSGKYSDSYDNETGFFKNSIKKPLKNKLIEAGKQKVTISASQHEEQNDDLSKESETGIKSIESNSNTNINQQDSSVVNNVVSDLNKKDVIKDSINTANNENKKEVTKKSVKKSLPLYFIAAAGADVGSVKLFSFGKSSVTPKYGLGVGYQFGKKWSVQTGFYATRKKYAAGHDDYHVKAGSYWSHAEITKVDAACTIYEIPVTARFDFKQKATVSYYASLGLSSYLMKKEDYNYHYILYNVPGEKFYSYTGNKHFLSNLNVSAGIEKKLSNSIALQVEPSVSIPLSGVGDGKVKLYSTSIMVGIKYTPFKK